MVILPLDWRGALHVALYARESDRLELDACMARYDAAYLAGVSCMARFGCIAALDDQTPVAVLTATEGYPGTYHVGMFATDDWFKVARGLTRWGVRVLKPALLAAGGHRAECRSIDFHHEAHRWLEYLGFVREAVLPDCGKGRETFYQYAWRLSDVLFERDGEDPGSRRLHRREELAEAGGAVRRPSRDVAGIPRDDRAHRAVSVGDAAEEIRLTKALG